MDMILGPNLGRLSERDVVDAYPWPDQGRWVRAMMVTTLDGAATGPDGLSGSISSAADRSVFDAVRRLADVVLIGAGTLRAERYGPMRATPDDAEARAAAGQAPAPVLAVVSGSLDLPWDDEVFGESTVRPIVFTGPDADPERLARAEQRCEVVTIPGDGVDAEAVLDALEARGLRRVVCEGGPGLLAAVVAAGLLDEADITLSPMFAGGAGAQHTDRLAQPAELELRHVIAGDGFLMTRYVRTGGV